MADKVQFSDSGAELETKTSSYTPALRGWSHVIHAKASGQPPMPAAFQAGVGMLMIGALFVTAVFTSRMEAKEHATVAAASPAPALTEALETGFKDLRSQVDGLTTELKGLQGKVDGLPMPETTSDLKPIQTKVDDLARMVAAVVPMTDKVNKLDEHLVSADAAVKSIEADVKGLAAEVSGLAAELRKLAGPAPAPALAAGEPKTEAAVVAPALPDAVSLFKAGKYKEAGDVFRKIEAANPQDARVFYYEAFINALTTNDWKGETVKMAAKGAALEKVGTTKPAEVDAAFSDLPASLKPWLAFFRSQAN